VTTFSARARRASAVAVAVAIGFGAALVAAPAANAATLTVTSTADSGAGSLREAIGFANSGAFPGADVINITATGTITLALQIAITEGLTIVGPGLGNLTITRNASFDMFSIDMAATNQDLAVSGIDFVGASDSSRGFVVLSNVLARNFSISNSQFSGFNVLSPSYGGGIYVDALSGNFSSTNTDYFDNLGTNVGTGICLIDVAGTVSISDSLFDNNTADAGAAFFADTTGPVSISNTVFSNNTTVNGGGAFFVDSNASVTISGSTFSLNEAQTNDGGAGYIRDTTGTVLIQGSTFTGNTSSSFGGALVVNGSNVVSGANGLNVTGSTFTGNSASDGGAIHVNLAGPIAITTTTFSLNEASTGGALNFAGLNAILTINRSTFDSNTSSTDGGAILFDDIDESATISDSSFIGNGADSGFGGGVFANTISDELLLSGDTFTENHADVGGTSIGVGAITGALAIGNSTFLEDDPTSFAVIAALGGVQSGAFLVVVSSTVLGNVAIAASSNDGLVLVSNSIIDGDLANQDSDPFELGGGSPFSIEWSILTAALDPGTMLAGSGNQYSTNPQLGTLTNNGGPTRTMLPLAGSPAIDLGNPAYNSTLIQDQRGTGFARIVQGRVDIGAVETQLATLAATGLEISPLLPVGGALLLLAGIALFVVARRRRAA
jgi:predicted outer membrane repeat protein